MVDELATNDDVYSVMNNETYLMFGVEINSEIEDECSDIGRA